MRRPVAMKRLAVAVWPGLHSCSMLESRRERGSRGRVDDAVTKPVLPMLLVSTHPHDDLCIKVLGARVVRTDLAADVYSLMRVWTLELVYASGGSSGL